MRTLRDGRSITVRPVIPEDREAVRKAFLSLSPASVYFRFLSSMASPTDRLLTYLTSVDQVGHVAICATIDSPDLKTERGIGIARFIRLEGLPDTAEAAITVVDDMHRRGVASILLHELVRAAQVRGIKTLRAEVVTDNEAMVSILERAGAKRVLGESGGGTVAYDFSLAGEKVTPDAPSLFDLLRAAAETMAIQIRRHVPL